MNRGKPFVDAGGLPWASAATVWATWPVRTQPPVRQTYRLRTIRYVGLPPPGNTDRLSTPLLVHRQPELPVPNELLTTHEAPRGAPSARSRPAR